MRKPARTLILIEQDGNELARLYDDDFVLVEEFDASSEEVAVMVSGLKSRDASDAAYDKILRGHNAAERSRARVFSLDV
jgi:hypothetical protein